jgi:DNA repair protein RadC
MKTQQSTIAEVQLIYKSKVKASGRKKISCSRDAYKIFMENRNVGIIEFVEEFKILLMNRSNSVPGILEISVHNHPSGNMNPGESDTRLTQKIREAGNLMDIQLLDHLIITTDNYYYSFADNGLI